MKESVLLFTLNYIFSLRLSASVLVFLFLVIIVVLLLLSAYEAEFLIPTVVSELIVLRGCEGTKQE